MQVSMDGVYKLTCKYVQIFVNNNGVERKFIRK